MREEEKTTMEECISVLDHCIDELFILFGVSSTSEYTLFTNNYAIIPLEKKGKIELWQNNHKLPD